MKKHITKVLLSCVLCVLLVFTAAGCGSSQEEEQAKKSKTQTAKKAEKKPKDHVNKKDEEEKEKSKKQNKVHKDKLKKAKEDKMKAEQERKIKKKKEESEKKEKKQNQNRIKKKPKKIKKKVVEKPQEKKIDKYAIAKSYVGKSLNSLISRIGRPKRVNVGNSCEVDGAKEGIAYFQGFKVTVQSEPDSSVLIIRSISK